MLWSFFVKCTDIYSDIHVFFSGLDDGWHVILSHGISQSSFCDFYHIKYRWDSVTLCI